MADIVIPEVGESITEGTLSTWYVKVGDAIAVDQPIFELETDKITTDVPSPVGGVVTELLAADGEDVMIGAVVARVDESAKVEAAPAAEAAPAPAVEAAPAAEAAPAPAAPSSDMPLPPATRRMVEEHGVDASQVTGSGVRGQILKEDVQAYLATDHAGTMASIPAVSGVRSTVPPVASTSTGRSTRRVPMTRLRRRIAQRLKEVQNTSAILTTFNEVDMKPVMDLRSKYKQAFIDKHGNKLGFMSFFVKAAIEALKEFPAVNGTIDGDDIVYNEFYDVGIAVSSKRGLVVPVLRDADRLSFAEIEKGIGALAGAARDGALTLDQLSGGTFTITNGGTFGSMLSTPILNAPQSAILGMHNIVKRPWVVGDSIEVRPIMYLALSYDHRIIDGSQAVRFLVKIKQVLEDPARLLLEV
ncbi:MAG: 2-oxoglutarate dehydrogenase complex dihydrolipoyllysine-residue succinyltransferase [Deltaproteobacteria bacterium]|nr:2-oxoglutarate dehydrogenase complex dihydrolipoyllysine-residue succinyltransferase [Deltaproteobacteria bacterium]